MRAVTTEPATLTRLASVIALGLTLPKTDMRPLMKALFGERYPKRHCVESMFRDAYSLAVDEGDGVPWAGLINPDNSTSGPYGGTSVVWMPSKEHGSLLTFVVGTKGLSPDEGILTRPGHRRRIAALRRYLARLGVETWTKPDPAALGVQVPEEVERRFPGFESAFKRYGHEFYCVAQVPLDDPQKAERVVQVFFDLYAFERGWQVLSAASDEYRAFHAALRSDLFPRVDAPLVNDLLRSRRFVILQGPPGTGKTRLTQEVATEFFSSRAMTVQFHPAVTYEDFVVGLSPDPVDAGLRFRVRPGWLLLAAEQAADRPFLLIVDEVNRADLGKVLGEAIYLFEAGEVGGPNARVVQLPHAVNGEGTFKFPKNLYVLATMNTADRSIATIDLAIRRRFAFVTMMPSREVVAQQETLPLATAVFDRLSDLFIEHAPDDALDLLPGHSYFLAATDAELRERFRYELLPLLDEYLRQGFLGPATTELHAVRDAIDDAVSGNAAPIG
jgi:5-methylcytosine-specific restriction protein B